MGAPHEGFGLDQLANQLDQLGNQLDQLDNQLDQLDQLGNQLGPKCVCYIDLGFLKVGFK